MGFSRKLEHSEPREFVRPRANEQESKCTAEQTRGGEVRARVSNTYGENYRGVGAELQQENRRRQVAVDNAQKRKGLDVGNAKVL